MQNELTRASENLLSERFWMSEFTPRDFGEGIIHETLFRP